MPDDLLRYISAPTGYSLLWLLLALGIVAVVIGWCALIFTWTLPASRLRNMRLTRGLHSVLVRRKFTRTIDQIRAAYRGGGLSAEAASAQIRGTTRSFLALRTGRPAQYMHVGDLAAGQLAPAAPLVAALNEVSFATGSQLNVDALAQSARELIDSWSA